MGILSYFKPAKGADKQKGKGEPTPAGSSVHSTVVGDGLLSGLATPHSGKDELESWKCDIMANYLHQQQQQLRWTGNGEDEGVVLKKSRDHFICCPASLNHVEHGFMRGIEALNVRVAMTVNTNAIQRFSGCEYIPLSNGLRVQVLDDIACLPKCQKHQGAAFIADRGQLVVWDDDPCNIIERMGILERELMKIIWQDESPYQIGFHEKKEMSADISEVSSDNASSSDVEAAAPTQSRPSMLLMPIVSAITLTCAFASVGSGWRQVAIEIAVDHNYIRVAFIFVTPLMIWMSLFFFQAVAGNLFQLFGPITQMVHNTKFYSGVAPKRLNRNYAAGLPHLTIQMPVYKEGLRGVIMPTIKSIKAAMATYEMQGGTANIFINDDGMQLIDKEAALERQEFYDEHNIGWVARPKHNPKPEEGEEVFLRRGKFKKASNMNYALWVSNRIEQKLAETVRDEKWTSQDEADAYTRCLEEVKEEDQGRTWASGNIRMGDYILLIDCDTRVPRDCFLDAVSEMEQNPNVAILQYASGVMNVTSSFFEKGITFFTNLIYTQIKYAVSSGDVAPFVGHNAILRWEAVQFVGYDCKDDGREKFWSENTVSEDFDMALRLQTAGYLVRLGGYTGEDGEVFREGVSLTVYDELARWEKYAYGCSELIFHPFRYWPTRGPFTKLFRNFIWSRMPITSKITIMAYIGTYYALGSAWILTLANYFLMGWFNGWLDHFYLDSFKVYFAIIIVFCALGNVSLAVLRFRIGEKPLVRALVENFTWVPLLSIFLGGVSLHVSQALLSHLFSVDMSWGSTSKEAENTTFFQEIPKVLKQFKFTFAYCIFCAAMMIVMAHFVPYLWRINLLVAIWPLGSVIFGHFMLPIALNPNLMLFTW